jgi:hypothetical protein
MGPQRDFLSQQGRNRRLSVCRLFEQLLAVTADNCYAGCDFFFPFKEDDGVLTRQPEKLRFIERQLINQAVVFVENQQFRGEFAAVGRRRLDVLPDEERFPSVFG